jgi:hypothetical protein
MWAKALDAKLRLKKLLHSCSWLRAIGIGMQGDGYCLRVYVAELEPGIAALLPSEVDGLPVEVLVIGEIVAQ